VVQITGAVTQGASSDFVLTDLSLDHPRPDELLVRTVAVGICHSDLTARALFPSGGVLGHEGAGVVEAVGSAVTDFEVGDHVVLTFDACGHCASCRKGRPYYCRSFGLLNFAGVRPDGSHVLHDGDRAVSGKFFGQSSFATRCLTTGRSAVKVDRSLPLETLAPLGCGVITGSGTVLNALRPEPGSSLVVFGVGSVGLSALMAAAMSHVGTLVAVDVVPARLDLAQKLGATHVIDGRSDDVAAQIRDITGGGADYVVETSGVAAVVRTALASVPAGGAVALVGFSDSGSDLNLNYSELVMGRTLVGVIEGSSIPHLFIPQLIQHWQRDLFPFDEMITTYKFADINQAVADTLGGSTIKAVLTF
jgi:aryl-alcohol dehydrogenase